MCIDQWLPRAIVKLRTCIYCSFCVELIEFLQRRVSSPRACVRTSVSVSAVKFDVWRHNSSPRPACVRVTAVRRCWPCQYYARQRRCFTSGFLLCSSFAVN